MDDIPLMEERRIHEAYPLPIARGYRRYQNAPEARERHDAAFYLFEIYLKYSAAIAIVSYLHAGSRDHRVNAALKGLARPSLGEWLRFLRECLRFLVQEPEPGAVMRAMAVLFEEKSARWTAVVELYNRLRAVREGTPSARGKASLSMLLEEIVAYRNSILGHGAPLEKTHYESFAEPFGEGFVELLKESPFLIARRLVAFEAPRVREGSTVECPVVEYMGLQPLRRDEPLRLPYGAKTPREGRLHLLGENGEFLPLDPLLIADRDDVFFLNEATGVPEYLSYATGDRRRPSDWGGAQEDLFERVLGYKLDAAAVSRIGEDVAPATERARGPEAEGRRRLGDYRIVREVGRGAMGIVFEAVQESLGRRVALKVLLGSLALDPRRLERFRREARATARLHHPSIVPVYEVGESDGNHFYAMEYIEGRPLDRVLDEQREDSLKKGGGGSAVSDAAYIAETVEQMATLAEGLSGAHRQGIVHRDVKPSNILLDASGRFILVDFGLVHEAEGPALTRSGEMVGTLKYMSPEQVSRSKVDARSDVYALGATLYEVLTLRAPFETQNDRDLERAILFKEPIPPRRLNPRLHRDLETIVLHALEKDPDRRYASAEELAADLQRFLRYEPIRARPASALTRVLRRVRRNKERAALVLLALSLATIAAVWWLKPAPPPRVVIADQRRLTSDPGLATDPALSWDGRLVAYASDRGGEGNLDIWVQPVEAGEPRRLTTHKADDREPALSPGGDEIAFRSEREGGGVYLVSVKGGEARKFADHGRRPRFSPDGHWIAYWVGVGMSGGHPSSDRVFVAASQGRESRQLVPHFRGARLPVWSPDGTSILVQGFGTEVPEAPPDLWSEDLWVVPLNGRPPRKTGTGGKGVMPRPIEWLAKGSQVLGWSLAEGSTSLWAILLSPTTLRALGDPREVSTSTGQSLSFGVNQGGRVVFAALTANVDIYSLPVDASEGTVMGDLKRLTANPAPDHSPSLSPDGRRLAFVSTRGGKGKVWLKDLENGNEAPLGSGALDSDAAFKPIWHRDGARIAYHSSYDGIYIQAIDGRVTRRASSFVALWDWSSDGADFIVRTHTADERPTVKAWNVASGAITSVLEHPAYQVFRAQFSPDERWICFNAVERSISSRIFIAPYRRGSATPDEEWIRVTDDVAWEDAPTWSPDGNLVYFTSERDGQHCIWARRLDADRKRPRGPVFEVYHSASSRRSLSNVRLDHQRISVGREQMVFSLGELTGDIWTAVLKE